jgi:hypothetical protein
MSNTSNGVAMEARNVRTNALRRDNTGEIRSGASRAEERVENNELEDATSGSWGGTKA